VAENEVQGEWSLPDGWVRTTLGGVQIDKSKSITPKKTPDETFELYSVPSFGEKKPEIVRGAGVGSSKRLVEENTVLLCKINPRINRVWIVGDYSSWLKIASTEWIPFFQVEGVEPSYLCYFMQQNAFRDFLALRASGVGGSLMRVKPSTFESYPFLLAPLPEQRRIVAEIETQFTRLDAGVAALERAQANLKRYRTSVLKAACEGRLVPAEAELARAEGRDHEPADQLLARILAERRARWEAEHPGKRYKEPASPDTEGLPELPEGWVWARLEQLAWHSRYGTSQKCTYDVPGPPVLRIPNISNGHLDLGDVKFGTKPEELGRIDPLAPNDLLIIRTNGSRDLIGRSALVRKALDEFTYFASYLIRFRLVDIDDVPAWIAAIWDAPMVREWLERVAATSAGQYNISIGSLNQLQIPLAPFPEQYRIVAEVERRLSVVAALEREVEAALARAARLRQSILKRAFEGRLVAQEPDDEPASVLLERIREKIS
jgi:type I restriction enzyme S subunit